MRAVVIEIETYQHRRAFYWRIVIPREDGPPFVVSSADIYPHNRHGNEQGAAEHAQRFLDLAAEAGQKWHKQKQQEAKRQS